MNRLIVMMELNQPELVNCSIVDPCLFVCLSVFQDFERCNTDSSTWGAHISGTLSSLGTPRYT